MTDIRRRNLLLGGTALLGAAMSGGFRIGRAQGAPTLDQTRASKKLIVILNQGGWDPAFVLDPKPDSPAVDIPVGSIGSYGDLSVWQDESRSNVAAYFEQWASQTALIHGIELRSVVHDECIEQMITGVSVGQKPDLGATVASQVGSSLPIPYLTLGGRAMPGEFAYLTGSMGFTNQIATLVNPLYSYPPKDQALEASPFVPNSAEANAIEQYRLETRAHLKNQLGDKAYNTARLADFSDSQLRAKDLIQFAQDSGLTNLGAQIGLQDQWPVALEALKQDFSQVAFLQTDGWDTHEQNERQNEKHNDLFGSMAQLMAALNDEGMLETTNILVLSEMGRTPKLNTNQGKDHWPFTSAMLVGGGISGGRSYGLTDNELRGETINIATGTQSDTGRRLRPSNLLATVLQSCGVNPTPYFPKVEVCNALLG